MRGSLSGARFLDLYAGSGAVGLEAASRGAVSVLLVDSNAGAARVAAQNARVVGDDGVRVDRTPVHRLATRPVPAEGPFDVVFCDPPYETPPDEVATVLQDLAGAGWLAPASLVVVERASREEPFGWPPALTADRSRRYGEGTLWYGRAASSGP